MATNDFETGVAIPEYADATQGDGLLRIQWRNGEPKLDSAGRFFVSTENLGDFVPGKPWVKCREIFEDGTKADGYKAEVLQMAVVCARSQPFHWSAANGTQGRYKIWQTKWIKGDAAPEFQSMQVELLAWVQGFEDMGPVVWTSSTIKTSFAIIAQDGILKAIDTSIVKPASATAKTKLDRYCFWATVATQRDAKGEVVYTPTKGKPVTLPVLMLPPEKERNRAWLVASFVGKDLISETLAPMREQYEEWRQERRTNDDADQAPPPARANGNGRNVPQELSEADINDDDYVM